MPTIHPDRPYQNVQDALLPGVPLDRILACYSTAGGNEIESGKFASPESSAALVANTFGFFLDRANDLPPLPCCEDLGWPAVEVNLEALMRFPWSGGRHPCLDALVITNSALIGIESKRYEPFRPKHLVRLSEAYWRPVWGDGMTGYARIRDQLRDGNAPFLHLDAAQLVKHAFGLRTAVHRPGRLLGKKPVLFYLCAEPISWSDGSPVDIARPELHRSEVALFATEVAGDEVEFVSCSYRDLLRVWSNADDPSIRGHASAVLARFAP